jgi:P4 family phage/plasmid primase-like protien
LIRVLHGTLDEHFSVLKDLNSMGAGVFVCINKTDGRGRKTENIQSVRACFLDLDGASIDPVLHHELEPSMIVETSKGRYHAYWLCSDMPLEDFSKMQRDIAKKFGGDPAVIDPPRVMRIPGFFHQKQKADGQAEPFMTRIESLTGAAYGHHKLSAAFSIRAPEQPLKRDALAASYGNEGPAGDLRAALSFISPEDREVWIKVGHSLKSDDPNNLALYLDWSAGNYTDETPSSYRGAEDVIRNWNSFNPNRTGLSAIFALAKDRGYRSSRLENSLLLGSQVEVAAAINEDLFETNGNKLVYAEGKFWQYQHTCWQPYDPSELRRKVHSFDGRGFGNRGVLKVSRAFIDGTINELAAMSADPDFFEDIPFGVNLANGFITIARDGTVSNLPHAPDHRQRFALSQAHNPAISEVPDGYIRTLLEGSLGQDNFRMHRFFFELLGAALTGVNISLKDPKAFVLYGPTAANGKSAVQDVIRRLLPRSVVGNVSPADLGDPQFLATLGGCQVNLSDELSSSKAIASDKFKATVTGDPVQAKVVYCQPFIFKPRALHIFAANQLPSFTGGIDNGLERRLVVFPFNLRILERDRIPNLAERIVTDEGDILVSMAIQAAADLLKRGTYLIPEEAKAATEQWFREVDAVHEWYEDGGLERHVLPCDILVSELFKKFKEDTRDDGFQPWMNKRKFSHKLKALLSDDPKWRITRRKNGDTVILNTLV